METKICKNCNKEYEVEVGLQLVKNEGEKYKHRIDYCSYKCQRSSISKLSADKVKETNLKRYGVSSAMQSNEFKIKMKQTNIERYGSTCSLQNKEVREKVRQTCLEKYGVENPSQNNDVKKKIKQVSLKKYGTEHPMQNKEIKEKFKQTSVERYGSSSPMKNKEVQRKTRQTNLKRYGVEYIPQNGKLREKMKETCLEKYGVEFPIQNESIQEKIKQTCLEKYGVENPLQNKDIRDKIEQTNIERYRYKCSLQNKEVREKVRQTCLEKYGVINPFANKDIQEKIKQTNIEKYGTEYPCLNKEIKERSKQTNLEKYGVEYFCLTDKCQKASGNVISKINLRWKELFDKNNIPVEMEFKIVNRSYDFRISNTDILIEINPTYTHQSSIPVKFQKDNTKLLDNKYHMEKSKLAQENGYRCIHIWDWDDPDKIIKNLLPKETLYARKLSLREISEKDTNMFLRENHYQNSCKGQKIRLGLFSENEIVQIMTFGKPRYNKKYQYELLRLCSSYKYKIVGGVKRLFKHFLKEHNPESIISYCDMAKFNGDVYEKLNFKLTDKPEPSKHWSKGKQHTTDNLLRQQGFDRLFGKIYGYYGKGTNNRELMLKHGFVEVYDCGQATYIW